MHKFLDMKKYLLSVVGAALLPLLSTIALAKEARETKEAPADAVYGVVEVGASGVKGMVVQILPATADTENPPSKMLKQYEPLDKNAFTSEAATRVADAITKLHKDMQDEFKVPTNHFYLVGSSGLPPAVQSAISGKTFMEGAAIEYIDATKEANLVFRGIVPPARLQQVVVLDIGSGNSKGCYIEKMQPEPTFATFSVPWGTKTFAQEVNKSRKDASQFMIAADPLRTELILPKVQSATRDFPGMQNLRRVYLVGGTPWVLASLMHPESIVSDPKGPEISWVKISLDDINKYYTLATTDPNALLKPNLSGVRKESLQKTEEELTRLRNVFNQDQIMSGALILKTFADEMHFDRKDAIFFSKRALYAWPQGYILEKLASEKKDAAKVESAKPDEKADASKGDSKPAEPKK